MAWMISNAMMEAYGSLLSLPEPAEEYSEGIFSAGEPSAQSSTTPTPVAYYWPDKTTEHSRLSRFGMTSEPLTADRGEDMLMLFRAGFPAKTSVSLVKAMGSTESEADSGSKWPGSFARYDQASSTWRTAQCSLLGDSDEFSETWPRWGSMRNGVSYLRQMPALLTYESESGFWPTPVARDYRSPGRSRMERTGGKQGECLPQVVGGRLNPPWVEWMMGWPIGWTELKPLETAKFQEWLQQHGEFSQVKEAA